MFNKDNVITIGHKRKAQIKASIRSFMLMHINRDVWSTEDIYRLQGTLSYLKMVEPAYYADLVSRYECRYGKKLNDLFRECLA
jgi:hypothetical protein